MTDNKPQESEQTRAGDYDHIHNVRAVEALLFASSEPLPVSAIRERMGDKVDVGGILLELQEHYRTRGVNLVELENCWVFRTAADVADILSVERDVQRKLSRAAMETLSIIAYHQPVTRAEIENIRGVATSRGTLDVLMEAEWVKPGRRRETPGRPVTWVTTTKFLDQFGLEALTDLPGLDELKASGLLDRRPAVETIPGTADMFDDEEHENDITEDEDDHVDDDTYDSSRENE